MGTLSSGVTHNSSAEIENKNMFSWCELSCSGEIMHSAVFDSLMQPPMLNVIPKRCLVCVASVFPVQMPGTACHHIITLIAKADTVVVNVNLKLSFLD